MRTDKNQTKNKKYSRKKIDYFVCQIPQFAHKGERARFRLGAHRHHFSLLHTKAMNCKKLKMQKMVRLTYINENVYTEKCDK